MNPLIQLKTTPPLLIAFVLVCFALLPRAQAVSRRRTAAIPASPRQKGQNALYSLTTGAANTAVGWYSLFSDTRAASTPVSAQGRSFSTPAESKYGHWRGGAFIQHHRRLDNTAVGAAALLNNTKGNNNTASGAYSAL